MRFMLTSDYGNVQRSIRSSSSHLLTVYRNFRESEQPNGYLRTAWFIAQNDYNQKFIEKLDKTYYLSKFNPIKDYNLQMIFSTLPLSLEIDSSECISMVYH